MEQNKVILETWKIVVIVISCLLFIICIFLIRIIFFKKNREIEIIKILSDIKI